MGPGYNLEEIRADQYGYTLFILNEETGVTFTTWVHKHALFALLCVAEQRILGVANS